MMFLNLLMAIVCFGVARYTWHWQTGYMTGAMVAFGVMNLVFFVGGVLTS